MGVIEAYRECDLTNTRVTVMETVLLYQRKTGPPEMERTYLARVHTPVQGQDTTAQEMLHQILKQ